MRPMAERAPSRPPATTERPLGERDRAAIREDFAEGPLTGEERRFADLLAWEAQARADGADPRTLAALAKARRAAGRACHPAGLANDPAGLANDGAGARTAARRPTAAIPADRCATRTRG
ncbi:hypothetical protein [Methylobacterium sp. Leaf112]|uniref:hypothetical protein n=1 Tax=Methylobacterium sp. Leaf112 TaxID=1736258 RepID=UPI0012E7BBD1|nr:hypothetical protein [Methylobacterium sp. Leaf112]